MTKHVDDDDVLKASQARVAEFCTAMGQLMALRIADEIRQIEEDRRRARTQRAKRKAVQP